MEALALFAEGDLGETKAKILDAAFRRLANEGYAALSMREIAKVAGVNHALINYHFRSKDELVIAVLDAANREIVFAGDSPNDAPMFAFFERSVGVANVRRYAGMMAAQPRYVTEAEAGGGFAELARHLLGS